jgi:methylphosphotriester-DNA--protein-cysteine methyltransferase
VCAQWQVSRALPHIEASLKRPLQVRELAQLVNLSPSHFFRAFKFTVGVAPFHYIMRRRVQLVASRCKTPANPWHKLRVRAVSVTKLIFVGSFGGSLGKARTVGIQRIRSTSLKRSACTGARRLRSDAAEDPAG